MWTTHHAATIPDHPYGRGEILLESRLGTRGKQMRDTSQTRDARRQDDDIGDPPSRRVLGPNMIARLVGIHRQHDDPRPPQINGCRSDPPDGRCIPPSRRQTNQHHNPETDQYGHHQPNYDVRLPARPSLLFHTAS